MSVAVRTATLGDKPQLMEMARMFWADNGITDCEDDLLSAALDVALLRQGGIIGVIGVPGQTVEAMICLAITNFFWTRKTHLDEVMSFVRPEFRNGKPGHADLLIEFAMRCSSPDCPLISTVFTNRKTEGKAKLYRRHLGCPTAVIYTHNHALDAEQLGPEFWQEVLPPKKRGSRGAKYRGNGAARH